MQVLPATAAAQELPRTGVDTGTWIQLGLGLVLAGAGAMVAARRPHEATAR
jgi:LPXTG-motif cell wall-anchored protein